MSSLSKTLAPGLRLGYLVAPLEFIHHARGLRRLMVRHPPSNNQNTMALFLARGHHDALVRRLARTYEWRWQTMRKALDRHLPETSSAPASGGTSFWVCAQDGLDSCSLSLRARNNGVLIEPGDIHFEGPNRPANYFRLGFAAIAEEKIAGGMKALSGLMRNG